MPFVGKHRDTGERINILTVDNPRDTFQRGEVVCPLCGEPLFIKDGLMRQAHFSHFGDGCTSDFEHKPESPEHLFFKEYLWRQLKEHFAEYSTSEAILEQPYNEIKRIADIAFRFPSGWDVAHEIQLSAITIAHIQERTDDYRNAGVDVYWWLGGGGDSKAVRDWCIREYGGCFILDARKATEHLALHEVLRHTTG